MKNSETDIKFIDLIKNTLDNYEEHYILGSWEDFIRKRKSKRRLILWFTVSGIAASLLLGWVGFRIILSGSLGSNDDRGQNSITNVAIPIEKDTLKRDKIMLHVPVISAKNKNKERLPMNAVLEGKVKSRTEIRTGEEIRSGQSPAGSAANITSGSKTGTEEKSRYTEELSQDTIKKESAEQAFTKNQVQAESFALKSDTAGARLGYTQSVIKTAPEKDLSENIGSSRFRFGISLAPGITSTSTSTAFAYSGGISADYALSGRFLLSSGLQFERQNVINESNDNPAWIPSGQTQAILVDLDLPLNVTWKFLIRRSTCYYISGGISSVVYLSEKYISTTYTQKIVQSVEMDGGVPNVTYQLENVKNTGQTKEPPLSTFDFAGRVNIIFGFQQHLSSRLFLHLEPFVKIPVSDLATENLRYTTSGVICKISF